MKSLISVCSRAAAVSFSVVTACDQLSSAPDCSNSRRKITATSAPSAASSSDKKHLPIKASLPVYRKAEVEKHITPEKGIWITHGNGVYDVTDFVANHPGGREKIMLAAGKAVEPYWRLYRQHYNSELPHELLATMKIGTLHAEDAANAQAQFDTSDPYYNDPKLSPVMKQHSTSPINAEAPAQLIGEQWITPVDLWFVRNHHPVPAISEHSYRLKLKMALREDRFGTNVVKTLALADLKKFQKHTIVSSVQCGGNRRSEMDKIAKTAGTSWGVAAISTAEWSGALLRDVLQFLDSGDYEEAGYSHVMFSALEGLQASVPLHKAISRRGDVLLAYEMNGKPLEPQHGFPVRVIVPGHAGVRNVKWVTEIEVSDEEADGPWQRGMSYKGFNPSVGSLEGVDVSKIPSLQEMPVQSAITSPSYQANLPLTPGKETVKGYAYSGGGRAIIRVDVSADGGKSWKEAELLEGSSQPLDRAWAWTFWECDVDIPELPEGVEKSTVQLISRAVDASHNTQPDTVEGIWNLRGINNNAWHRVTLPLVTDDDDD